jgi:hypothetical protein
MDFIFDDENATVVRLAGNQVVGGLKLNVVAIQYDGMRDRHLPEYHFRGKYQQHKSHYALMAAGLIRAGVYPDFLDEAYGWGIDDMWKYAFYALVLYGRVAAERTGRSLDDIAAALAERRGIDLEDS